MQTFLIVMGSLVASSFLWIIPLLLMDRNKPEEDSTQEQNLQETSEENECEEQVYSEERLEEAATNSFYAFSIVDEMINVAFEDKIVSKRVSEEYAFSIN
ncbi:MAG: hypothetical protein ABIR81_12405 [Ginsengibacter sp.]